MRDQFNADNADRHRAEMRYEKALKRLESCLKRRVNIDAPPWAGVVELTANNPIFSLRKIVDDMLQRRQSSSKDRKIFESIFKALLPFFKHPLALAGHGQTVIALINSMI